jgi:hypothetical protein
MLSAAGFESPFGFWEGIVMVRTMRDVSLLAVTLSAAGVFAMGCSSSNSASGTGGSAIGVGGGKGGTTGTGGASVSGQGGSMAAGSGGMGAGGIGMLTGSGGMDGLGGAMMAAGGTTTTGAGGAHPLGGVMMGAGGMMSTGGVHAAGGVVGSGGAMTGTGGAHPMGGTMMGAGGSMMGSGGTMAMGGVIGSGGTMAMGGMMTGAGGKLGSGGTQGAGGMLGSGGTTEADAGASCQKQGTLTVTASGTSAYVIDGMSNPSLTFCRGMTYTFAVNAMGHPFYIKTVQGTGTGNAYSSGVTGNGTTNGDVVFAVPADAPATLFYDCEFHAAMTGTIHTM